jgi:hypothetical protein
MYPPARLLSSNTGPTISSGLPGRPGSQSRILAKLFPAHRRDVPAVLLAAALLAASPISYVCPSRAEEALTPVISEGKIPGQIVFTLICILHRQSLSHTIFGFL